MHALGLYAKLVDCSSSDDIPRSLIQAFPTVWKWIAFLSPNESNVFDEGPGDSAQDGLVFSVTFHADGRLIVPAAARYTCLSKIMLPFLLSRSGRGMYIAQPDAIAVTLGFLSCSAVVGAKSKRTISSTVSSLMKAVDDANLFPSFVNDAVAFDDINPGVLLCNISRHARWLTSGFGGVCYAAEERVHQCVQFIMRMMTTSTRMTANFESVGGMVQLVQLFKALTLVLDRVHGEQWSSVASIVLECITVLHLARPSHAALVAALDNGLLLALYNVSATTMTGLMARVREAAGAFIRSALIHQLIWPGVRRAFGAAMVRHNIDSYISENHWPDLRQLIVHFKICDLNRVAFEANRGSRYQCNNPKCASQRGRRMKMCACAMVFYCSKKCQKMHWRSTHRRQCAGEQLRTVTQLPSMSLAYGDSSIIKFVALYYALMNPLTQEDLHPPHRALIVRLDMFDAAGPQVHLIDDFLPGLDGFVHIYTTVIRARQEATFLVVTARVATLLTVAGKPAFMASMDMIPSDIFI